MDLSGPTEHELKSEFNSLGIRVDDSQILLCATICKRCNVPPDYLVETWIAFAFSSLSGNTTPTADNLLLMEAKELTSSKVNNSLTVSSPIDISDDIITPIKQKHSECTLPKEEIMEEGTPDNVQTENQARYKFPPEMIYSYGCEKRTNIVPLNLQPLFIPNVDEDSCLYNTLKDEANFLTETTFRVIDTIISNNNICDDENEDDSSYYSGRIVQNPDSKLNPNCIKLYNPEKGEFTVDVSQLNEYSLFPGQVIVVKGIKSGLKIIASHIYDNGRLPLSDYSPTLPGKTAVLVTAGPFIENLNDTSSLDFIVKLSEHLKPQAIVILGPIINSKAFASPESVNFHCLFEEVVQHLNKKIEKSIKVYCVINKLDKYTIPVYPLLPPDMSTDKHVTLLPDPALVDINGIVVALSSTDILLHMAKHEIQKNCSERFVRLSDHCIKQQTLYPLYPADLSVSIDYKLWGKYSKLSHSPHVAFFNSAFKYFVKESNGKHIIINPGSMSSKKETRTFALLEIHGSESNHEWDPNNSVSVKIFKA